MLVFVSYHPSGRLLFDSLEIENKQYLFRPQVVETGRRKYFLVRWGSRARCRFRPSFVLNSKTAISNSTHRIKMYSHFCDGGVLTPLLPYPTFPCFAFLSRSERGNGVVFVFSAEDVHHLRQLGYDVVLYSAPIRIKREYRVHVVIDQMPRWLALEKQRPREFSSSMFLIRNAENGYRFRYCEIENPLGWECVKAVRSLGLDFGAVDCCEDDLGHYWIFEVNTAPGLRGESQTVEFYKGFIQAKYEQWKRMR